MTAALIAGLGMTWFVGLGVLVRALSIEAGRVYGDTNWVRVNAKGLWLRCKSPRARMLKRAYFAWGLAPCVVVAILWLLSSR